MKWCSTRVVAYLWILAFAALALAVEIRPGEIPPMTLPLRFRAKTRAWLQTSREPTLLVYHYDGVERKTREDYYTLVDMFHKRFMTDIKDFTKGLKHWIFHKQPKSPRMCIKSPIFQSFIDQATANTGVYIGDTVITMSDTDEKVVCQHWRFIYDRQEVETCLLPPATPHSRPSGVRGESADDTTSMSASSIKPIPGYYRPVLIQHPAVRLEVLHFEHFDDTTVAEGGDGKVHERGTSHRAPPEGQRTAELEYLQSTLSKLKTKDGQGRGSSTFSRLPEHWRRIFDPKRASKAKCSAWG